MLLTVLLSCAIAFAAAAPATYDERQEGDFNVRADVQNVVFLVAVPQKTQLPTNLFDGFFKNVKPAHESELQERADGWMEAFVEPNTPYQVEIGSEGDRSADGDGRAVEVVIAGRKHQNTEVQAEGDEMKLLGAMEQCGPDRERDPVTLTCRARAAPADSKDGLSQTENNVKEIVVQPEVVPASS